MEIKVIIMTLVYAVISYMAGYLEGIKKGNDMGYKEGRRMGLDELNSVIEKCKKKINDMQPKKKNT